jgi:hypothetical protein
MVSSERLRGDSTEATAPHGGVWRAVREALAKSDRAAPAVTVVVLLFCATLVARTIHLKPLWNDEIFTWYICRLPDMKAVWAALRTGCERTPPLWHVLVRMTFRLLGRRDIFIRVPAAAGFFTMCGSLYWFVSRRLPRSYAAAAALFPIGTVALWSASEGRNYGAVLGWSGLAIVCWQGAAGGRFRRIFLPCLSIACACAFLTHYYGALILVPIGFAEAVRSLRDKRIDWSMCAALLISLAPLPLLLPLVRGAVYSSRVFWAPTHIGAPNDSYFEAFGYGRPLSGVAGFAVLFTMAIAYGAFVRRSADRPWPDLSKCLPDICLGIGFLLLPFPGIMLAIFTHAFLPRYVIPMVLGISICVVYAAYIGSGGSRAFGGITMLWAAVMAVLVIGAWQVKLNGIMAAKRTVLDPEIASLGMPIVFAESASYLEYSYYAPPALRRRLYYLADPEKMLAILKTDSVEQAVLALSGFTDLQIAPYDGFVRQNPVFAVVDTGTHTWLITALLQEGASVKEIYAGRQTAYRVEMRP